MNHFFYILLCITSLLYLCQSVSWKGDALAIRQGEGMIFQKCNNLTIGGQKVNGACVTLSQTEDCGLNVGLSVGNTNIFSQNMDLELVPQVCGQYSTNGVTCDFCISLLLQNDNATRCIDIIPTCGIFKLDPIDAGCFNNSLLDSVVACTQSKCPNDCSGHGNCINGKCECNSDFYGDDCSYPGQLFDYCRRIDEISGNLCVRVKYGDCEITVEMVMEGGNTEIPIYSKSFPITGFKQLFSEGQNVNFGICNIGLNWDDLILNQNEAHGCGSVLISCTGGLEYPYSIGCFNDTQIAAKCFGPCENDCSNHGFCNNGFCYCNSDWTGDDCSSAKGCPNDCSDHGKCMPPSESSGLSPYCSCNNGYAGTDCSIINPSSSSSGGNTSGNNVNGGDSKGKSGTKIAVGIIVSLVLLGVFGAIIFIWYRRRNAAPTPQFTQLDLISAEEEEDLVD